MNEPEPTPAEKLDAAVREAVDAAPPLTDKQRHKLATLLIRPASTEPDE